MRVSEGRWNTLLLPLLLLLLLLVVVVAAALCVQLVLPTVALLLGRCAVLGKEADSAASWEAVTVPAAVVDASVAVDDVEDRRMSDATVVAEDVEALRFG